MAESTYKNVFSHRQNKNKPYYGKLKHDKKSYTTLYFATEEEAARAVDRFLFKVGKPTNFPLKKKDGEALSKMTLEEIETQFRTQGQKTNFSRGPSQYRGVCWHSGMHRWRCEVKVKRIYLYTGYHATEEQAALAQDAAAYLLYGRDAKLNFPDRFLPLPQEEAEALSVSIIGLEKAEKIRAIVRGDDHNSPRQAYGDGVSKYKGVAWHKGSAKWAGNIRVRGVRIHLGYTATEEEAAVLYDAAAYLLNGRATALNFPDRLMNLSHDEGRALVATILGNDKVLKLQATAAGQHEPRQHVTKKPKATKGKKRKRQESDSDTDTEVDDHPHTDTDTHNDHQQPKSTGAHAEINPLGSPRGKGKRVKKKSLKAREGDGEASDDTGARSQGEDEGPAPVTTKRGKKTAAQTQTPTAAAPGAAKSGRAAPTRVTHKRKVPKSGVAKPKYVSPANVPVPTIPEPGPGLWGGGGTDVLGAEAGPVVAYEGVGEGGVIEVGGEVLTQPDIEAMHQIINELVHTGVLEAE